jgi:hypothetical protein
MHYKGKKSFVIVYRTLTLLFSLPASQKQLQPRLLQLFAYAFIGAAQSAFRCMQARSYFRKLPSFNMMQYKEDAVAVRHLMQQAAQQQPERALHHRLFFCRQLLRFFIDGLGQ